MSARCTGDIEPVEVWGCAWADGGVIAVELAAAARPRAAPTAACNPKRVRATRSIAWR